VKKGGGKREAEGRGRRNKGMKGRLQKQLGFRDLSIISHLIITGLSGRNIV